MGVTARVKLTIEMDANSSWGPEVKADQVFKQARESVLGQLRQCEQDKNHPLRFRIIGEPEVTAIISPLGMKE